MTSIFLSYALGDDDDERFVRRLYLGSVLIDLRKPVVVSGAAARVGLAGMGGIGKSVLANALAHHPEVQRAFRDNIYWISIGQTPNIEDLQRKLASPFPDQYCSGRGASLRKSRQIRIGSGVADLIK
jgi:hypothetical protein